MQSPRPSPGPDHPRSRPGPATAEIGLRCAARALIDTITNRTPAGLYINGTFTAGADLYTPPTPPPRTLAALAAELDTALTPGWTTPGTETFLQAVRADHHTHGYQATVITNTRESHWYWFARDLELIDVIATGHADTAAQAIHRADTAITAHHALKRHPHTTPTE